MRSRLLTFSVREGRISLQSCSMQNLKLIYNVYDTAIMFLSLSFFIGHSTHCVSKGRLKLTQSIQKGLVDGAQLLRYN